ncbi:hypothetical protein D6D01_07028 [Aureobasidium pullulans]|uniref:Uncharacterized protein n=1 Tax=Aureobasidium pullulans TaxID=5580 RepID=A0A4S9KUA9_AURPU|nr:hypothetical protein D6D01_07028 [Aureobasidium pullulans]
MPKWGLVIYRCTYGDDEAWAQFMAHINKRTLDPVAREDRMDMASSLDWSVQEDPTLERASKVEVRRRFRNWVIVEGRKEDGSELEERELHHHPRFNFCIHVDADSLDAVVRRGPQPGDDLEHDARARLNEGYVNIIRADCEWT